MTGDPKQASSATMAISYITLGALTAVWAAVYYFYHRQVNGTSTPSMLTTGFFFTGLVLVGIGLFVGKIGRSARQAEVMSAPTQVVAPAAAVPQAGYVARTVPMSPPTAISPLDPVAVHQTSI
jgi:hypothetical protein